MCPGPSVLLFPGAHGGRQLAWEIRHRPIAGRFQAQLSPVRCGDVIARLNQQIGCVGLSPAGPAEEEESKRRSLGTCLIAGAVIKKKLDDPTCHVDS